ncbi:MAG TPA: hypothetical protein VNO31_42255 [Umezawaea sp.]|nr:hypothetical protein [Umezawaea sp.]
MTDSAFNAAAAKHWSASGTLTGLQESYADIAWRAYQRRVDGHATRSDYESLGELAEQLARLHADEADYFTRMVAQHAEWAAQTTPEGS